MLTDSYRGILVADHLSKILTALLQRHLDKVYTDTVGHCQFGAVKYRGTALASLMLRAFIDLCVMRAFSYFILFIDLSKAYDYAVREVVTGWMRSQGNSTAEEKQALLVKLGVPDDVALEIVQWIDATGGLLGQLGVDAKVHSLVNCVHDGAWFRLPDDSKFL
eukprot:913407-Karenia_brevis.AAC.1